MAWRRGNRLRLVGEREASGRTREIFAEIKQALGVPHVNVILQAYAAYPKFLDLFWRAMKPLVATQDFFQCGERLRADAYTRMHIYFKVPDLGTPMADLSLSAGARAKLMEVAELFHYVNPLLLLLAMAQLQAFEGRVGEPRQAITPARHPVFSGNPLLLEEDIAPPEIRKIYEDMRRILALPVLDTAYLGFARWPDFLENYWKVLKELVQLPLYPESLHGVWETAWALVREFPVPIDLTVTQLTEAGLSDDELSAVTHITGSSVNTLSGLVLNVSAAKIALEGGNIRQREPKGMAPQAA